MSKKLIVESQITLNASLEKVWDALVNPEQTQKYMFGCKALSDWAIGSPLLWEGTWEGQTMVFVKGFIEKINPPILLAYSTFDPNNPEIADIPENYVTVTYKLSEQQGQTLLEITQGDFSTVANGQKRYEETYNNGEGWNPILVQIKTLVES